MKPDVVLRHLSIAVAATDQSYMPQQVTVAVGRTASPVGAAQAGHSPSWLLAQTGLRKSARDDPGGWDLISL